MIDFFLFGRHRYNVGRELEDGQPLHVNARFNDLAHLKGRYHREEKNYLAPEERKSCKVRYDDLKLAEGEYHYVVSPKGSLYIDWGHQTPYHAGILGGRPVQSAGKLRIRDGKVVAIDASSGHYQPTVVQHERTMFGLHLRGLLPANALLALPKGDGAQQPQALWEILPRMAAAERCRFASRLQRSDKPERPEWVGEAPRSTLGRILDPILVGVLLCVTALVMRQ